MNKLFVLLMYATVVNCSFARNRHPEFEAALVEGAEMKMVLGIRDDEGAPVANASVRATIAKLYSAYSIEGVTDKNGIWTVEGVTTGNGVEIEIKKTGYAVDAT